MRGRALTVRPFLLLLTSEMKYADVILPLPLENSYTYSIPTDLEAAVTPGLPSHCSFRQETLLYCHCDGST